MQVPSRPTGAQAMRSNLILLVLLSLTVSACALSRDPFYQALRPTFEPLLLVLASPWLATETPWPAPVTSQTPFLPATWQGTSPGKSETPPLATHPERTANVFPSSVEILPSVTVTLTRGFGMPSSDGSILTWQPVPNLPTSRVPAGPSSTRGTPRAAPLATPSPAPPFLTGEARATAPEGIPIPSISAPPVGSPASSTPTVPSPTLMKPSVSYDCPATGKSDYETAVIALVNSARAANGLPSLTPQTQLTAAAREHSFDMACNNFASHTGSDGSTLRERVGRQDYTFSWIGENYYVGHADPQTAFSWWMNSTPHRDNILNVHYSQIGVGYAWDASSPYGGYYTVDFGHP